MGNQSKPVFKERFEAIVSDTAQMSEAAGKNVERQRLAVDTGRYRLMVLQTAMLLALADREAPLVSVPSGVQLS
jgi:hypothetical protein